MEPTNNELIGTNEASKILNIDRTGVIRRVAAGELVPVQKLPGTRGAYIFNRSDVEELAKATSAA
ncbi:helix-turn-helix domain-containing protein [Leifsonia sp. NPDC056824]|uniref:helix-turn-helix domain-containing protein n=1 Tax=Leifsonia sp. NPDC056824 TaxID=3345953 RepID=UPI0036748847